MSNFLEGPSFRVDQEANKKEYTWETSRHKEIWEHDTFETVEDCVKDYLENYAEENPQEVIFVGQCERYTFSVDGSGIIDDLEEQAYDEFGECAESWEPSMFKRVEDWAELDEQLTKVVTDWLKKHDDIPGFYKIVNIVEVPVR